MVWERFVRSAPGDVGKQHRAHPGVAARRFRLAIVNRRWRQQADARVPVLFVVPPEKTLTESTAVLDAPKAVRELRPIFQGSELALGKGIVVRHVRPAMRFRDTQIGE